MLAFVSLLWGSIPNAVKFGVIGLVAGVLVVWGSYTVGKHEGRQQAAVSASKAIAQAYKDRSHENATVDALDAYDLCLRLGGGVPNCRPLMRRLGPDQSPADDGSLSGRP